jgi:hypothetical protein
VTRPERGSEELWSMDGRTDEMRADGSAVRRIVALPGLVDGRVEFEPDYLNNGWLEEQISWSWQGG